MELNEVETRMIDTFNR